MRLKNYLHNLWTTLWYKYCYDGIPLTYDDFDDSIEAEIEKYMEIR
jgi:hypothetical protein